MSFAHSSYAAQLRDSKPSAAARQAALAAERRANATSGAGAPPMSAPTASTSRVKQEDEDAKPFAYTAASATASTSRAIEQEPVDRKPDVDRKPKIKREVKDEEDERKPKRRRADEPPKEKRLAIWKKKCPKNIEERLERVYLQRFFCIDRQRESNIEETFKVLGSTGNVYTVTISHIPACNCPDALKGNKCKHVLFVMLKVLSQPRHSELVYQKALLTAELEQIFAMAPQSPVDAYTERAREAYDRATGKSTPSPVMQETLANDNRRLPQEGDSCPICYEDFEIGSATGLVFCLGDQGCGNGLHKECFDQWARSTKPVTCVFCRKEWNGKGKASANEPAPHYDEGYLNVGNMIGLANKRDSSSYYSGPVRGGWRYREDYY